MSTYSSLLKALTTKVRELDNFVQAYDEFVSTDDRDALESLKQDVRDHQVHHRGLGIWKFRWPTKSSRDAATELADQLRDFDAGMKDRARNTYNTFRGKMDRLKALEKANTELERLQSAKVDLMVNGQMHTIDVSLKEVTKGGFGTILKGSCESLGGEVALKRPSDLSIEGVKARFEREAEIWATFNHENILPYHGVCYLDDIPHIVSPYVEDPDLLTYIRSHPGSDKPRILRDIARALAYLHAQTPPVIHGDIRAQNILIKSDGHIYVCDFGLTKYENTVTTASVQGAGAIEWLSPERLDFFRPDDPDGSSRSKEDDVYAFGITIAEVVLEDHPYPKYRGRSKDIIVGVTLRNLRPTGGSAAGRVWDIATQCWVKDPDQRPPMATVAEWLSQLVST